MKKVSVIMPIYNTDLALAHYTGNALGSIKYFSGNIPLEIIVIDNGSTVALDGLDWQKTVDVYHRNETNEGVAKAWNQGISLASGDYVCIVNSDVEVYEYWLNDLIESLEYADFVTACPMYDLPYGRAVEARERRLEWLDKLPKEYLVDKVDFSCFLTTKTLFDEVGLFREDLDLAYSEDVDFKMKCLKKQLICRMNKRVNTHHIGGATSFSLMLKNQIDLNKMMTENREKVAADWEFDANNVPKFISDNDFEERPSSLVNKSQGETPMDSKKVVRTKQTGDRVYVIEDSIARWVKNPETLSALGFTFGDIQMISQEEFSEFERDEPIDLKEEYQIEQQLSEVDTKAGEILGYKENV